MQFGGYELLGRLATGGYAHIFLAKKRGQDGLVCLKTLVPERARDEAFVRDFLAEAKLAQQLSHPNCVSIHELGRERGTFFICMEFIAGETLSRILGTWRERSPLPIGPMVSIIKSACDGLHHAHELEAPDGSPYNLVHRDVSPQNIMISYAGETKVVDFGVAKAEMEREETRTGVIKGKVRYMSPEQISFRQIDRRSDIFSLGLILYECLTGKQVFGGCSPPEIQYRLTNEPIPRVGKIAPTVDPELEEICARAMAFKLSERYKTAAEMSEGLARYLQRAHPQLDTGSVAGMMTQRLGVRARARTAILKQVLEGTFDDGDVRATFGARPVLALDIFGDDMPRKEDTSEVFDDLFDDQTVLDQSYRESPTFEDATPALEQSIPFANPDPPTTPTKETVALIESTDSDDDLPAQPLPLALDDPLDVSQLVRAVESSHANAPFSPATTPVTKPPSSAPITKPPPTGPTTKPPPPPPPRAPTHPPVETTKRINPKELEPSRPRRSPMLVWLSGFVLGLLAGVTLALALMQWAQ